MRVPTAPYFAFIAYLFVLSFLANQLTDAVESPWTDANRIAISADGNPDADADDVGATPFTLAVLAKAGLQDNLVHYSFNNFLEYKRIEPAGNRMWLGAMGGQSRWGFDAGRFHDAGIDPEGAVAHLVEEISKSTAEDPLYLVVAGPMELVYRALVLADVAAREHVVIVSHHDYNEFFKPRLWQRNWVDVRGNVPEIGYIRIKDQNGKDGSGLKGAADSDFHWLRDHADPNLNWVYDRIVAGKPDVSDAGMISWLIGVNGDDEIVTIPEMQSWFGTDVIPSNGGSSATPDAPAGVTPEVIPPMTENIFEEVDGRIVIEAESVPLKDDWILDTTEDGYSGEGYIRWMPSWIHRIDHQHKGVLIYKLRIKTPGVYRMALKSSHRGAPERDKWNDCWTVMGLNPVSPYGTTRKTYHSISRDMFESDTGFTWHTTHDNYGAVANSDGHFSQPVYDLEAGDHYFWICGRSGGFRIDKIHFFKQGVSGFKSDSEPVTPILSGTTVYSFGKAHISIDGSNAVVSLTEGTRNGWFSVLSKTDLAGSWTVKKSGLPIDSEGRGSISIPLDSTHEFFALAKSGPPVPPLVEFVAPDYSNGPLNGQLYWKAASGWTVEEASGVGRAFTADSSSAAVLNNAVTLSVGEKYILNINLQFRGSYVIPTGNVYAFLGGLKSGNTIDPVGTGAEAADANIQIREGIGTYRLLSNYSQVGNPISAGALNGGDVLQFDYELTLGADATNTTYTVRLRNLTDETDTGLGTVTGIDQTIYDALTGSGAYGFFQSLNPGNHNTGLTGVQVNSVSVVVQ